MNITKQNLTLAKNIVKLQKKTTTKWIFEEIGANTAVAYTLKQLSGASNIEFFSGCMYDQETQVWNPKINDGEKQWRSVSKEFVTAGINYYAFHYPDKNIYLNSFQTESHPTKVTHGRIGVKNNEAKSLYHVTIPDHYNRRTFQEIVGNIGLQLITECLDPEFTVTTPYIDQVYDGEEQNIKKTIDLMQKESVVCIDASGKLCRIEDLTRTRAGYQPLIIYKGSFNPPHKGHLYMMETIQKKYPNHKALFSISVNNYDKGDVSSHEIIDRITMINTLGYPVMLFGSAYFKDNMDRVRLKNGQEIVFPVGSDTAERIFKTYDDKNKMIDDFERVRFESFGRAQFQFDSAQHEELFMQNDENPYSLVSSSAIRTNITENIHNIPEKIHDLCLQKYGHGYINH